MKKATKWVLPLSLLMTVGVYSGALDASAKTITHNTVKQTSMSDYNWQTQKHAYNKHRGSNHGIKPTTESNKGTTPSTGSNQGTTPTTETNQESTPTTSSNQGSTSNTNTGSNTSTSPSTNSNTSSVSQFEQKVIELTNAERAKEGLKALQADTKLMQSARLKSDDMAKNNYFDHTSPTYGSPFDQMKSLGISYKSAGENIAQGQKTPEEVVQAWMDSPGHRANIMNASYTHIGVGYSASGNYWTQQFIGK